MSRNDQTGRFGSLSALALFIATPANSAADTMTIDGEQSEPVTLGDGESLTLTSRGVLRTPQGDAVSVDSSALRVRNRGAIKAPDHTAIHIESSGSLEEGLQNQGRITGNTAVRDLGGETSVTNRGEIHTTGTALHMGDDNWSGDLDNRDRLEADNGHGLQVDGDWTGTLSNSGKMITHSYDLEDDTPYHSVFVGGTWEGDLRNSGEIHSVDEAVRVEGDLEGEIVNSGTIKSDQETVIFIGFFDPDEGISGDDVGTTLAGDFTNEGEIHSQGAALFAGDIEGNLRNTGRILSKSTTGIELEGQLEGDFTNTGQITALSDAVSISGGVLGDFINTGEITSLDSTGIVIGEGIGGNFSNEGIIETHDTSVEISDGVSGDFNNSGTIFSRDSTGIDITGGVGGDFTNSGEIETHDTAVNLRAGTGGSFVNSGTIVSHDSTGLDLRGGITGNFINTGTLKAHDDTVYIQDGVEGEVRNEGTIRSTDSTGMEIQGGIGGDLVNSGTIEAHSDALVVRNGDVEGDFLNTGTIITNQGEAITFSSDTISSSVLHGSFINESEIISKDSTAVSLGDGIIGDFVNSGEIVAHDTGISISNGLEGNFTNTGKIRSLDSTGVDIRDGITGNITNSGTIEAHDTAVYTRNGINGNFSNSGAIMSRDSTGVDIGGSMTGNFSNSGTIDAHDTGALVSDGLTGDFENLGTITSRDSTGVHIRGAMTGDFSNSGTINSHDTGVRFSMETFEGSFSNSGTIFSRDSTGVRSVAGITGDFENSGTIAAQDTGISVRSGFEGGFLNTGSISSEQSEAINIEDGATGTFVNEGQIGSALEGILIEDGFEGSIDNSGDIESEHEQGVRVTEDDDSGEAFTGDLTNTGTISARREAIYAEAGFDGELVNEGRLESRSNASVIRVGSSGDGASIENRGEILSRGGGHAIEIEDGEEGATINILGGRVLGSIYSSGSDDQLLFDPGTGVHFLMEGAISGIDEIEIRDGTVTLTDDVTDGESLLVGAGGRLNLDAEALAVGEVTNQGVLRTQGASLGGDYTQEADARLVMLVAGEPDMLDIGGDAQLDGSTLELRATGFVADGESWTALEADDLQASDLDISGTSAMLDFSHDITDTSIEIDTEHAGTVSAVSRAGGGNGLGLAGALDEQISDKADGGDFTSTFSALADQTFSAESSRDVARLMARHGPATGGMLAGSNLAAEQVTRAVSRQQRGDATGLSAGDETAERATWLRVLGSTAERDRDSVLGGYEMDSTGLALGGDVALNGDWTLGGSLALSQTDVDGTGEARGTDVDIDSTFLSVYASFEPGAWYLDGQLSAGLHEYDQTRQVIGEAEQAEADYDGTQWLLHSEVGYSVPLDQVTVTPLASVEHSRLALDSYSESEAGGFGLDVDSQDLDTTRSRLGARVETEHELEGGATTALRASAAWQREHGDLQQDTTARFLTGGPAFESEGLDVSRNGAALGVGANLTTAGGLETDLAWDADLRSDYSSHQVTLDVRWQF